MALGEAELSVVLLNCIVKEGWFVLQKVLVFLKTKKVIKLKEKYNCLLGTKTRKIFLENLAMKNQ